MNEHELDRGLRAIHQERADAADVAAARRVILAAPIEALPQRRSWLPHVDTRSFRMSSALGTVAAVAIVALFGGLLLRGVLTVEQPEQAIPVAAPGASTGALASCPPDATPDQPGPVDQARPPVGQALTVAFDRAAGKIVYLAVVDEQRETWLFDVCTNTWSLASTGALPVASVGAAIYDPVVGLTILVDDAAVWAYDLPSNTWTERQPPPWMDSGPLRLAFDSGAGQVVALSLDPPYPMWRYDALNDRWHPVEQAGVPIGETFSTHILFAYDGSVGRLFAYGLQEVDDALEDAGALFDAGTGTWEPIATGPDFTFGGYISWGGEIVYDESAGRTVLSSDGHVIAYDAIADRWETLFQPRAADGSVDPSGYPQGMHGRLLYDPINERIVSLGGEARFPDTEGYWAPRDDVWAFDARAREWMELLPSAIRPD